MLVAVIVGRLGMHQLGAVGLSNMVFFFVTVFFSFMLVVTTPKVADALAANDSQQAWPFPITVAAACCYFLFSKS